MTKTDLIDAIADKAGSTKKDAAFMLQMFIDTITDSLSVGEKVAISGFGTFEVRERSEKRVINPRTKEEMITPPCKAPAFKAGKSLKSIINKNK